MFIKKFFPVILALACYDCQASIIDFDTLRPFSNGTAVPSGFGSTADVTVSYQTLNTNGTVANSDVLRWNTGYANLNTAAYAHQNGKLLSITLTAVNPSMKVNLSSFQVAAYGVPGSTRSASDLRVVDGSSFSTILVDYAPTGSPFAVSGTTANIFTPNVSAHSLRIVLGTDWNNGINKINFSAVPLPAAFWLFGSALAGLGLIKKGRSSRTSA